MREGKCLFCRKVKKGLYRFPHGYACEECRVEYTREISRSEYFGLNIWLRKHRQLDRENSEEVVNMAKEVWEELYGPSILGRVECCCGCVHSTGVSEENSWEYYCSVLGGQTDLEVVEVKGFNVCYEYKKDEMR